jgi:hypothetical protein
MEIPWRKDPGPAFEGMEECLEFLEEGGASQAHSHIHNATEQLVRKSRWSFPSKSEDKISCLPVRNIFGAIIVYTGGLCNHIFEAPPPPPLVVLFGCVRRGSRRAANLPSKFMQVGAVSLTR